ncbi:cytochrome P450 [Lentinus tigrinus ALCF2SS1-7]|uniref:Cytochrome P450 n=1 Tax=Lentinus tigrinus ALCF2SS1-6 TaxID=1328759 RepID=A0A5C2SH93_9APHY|nr:cytochrome P450 [Lentinus tigrinus ALCF2SS1-6]RPD77638.1 cytochrome P450 [Lentinus tigrinus ALCF2SS1-7]
MIPLISAVLLVLCVIALRLLKPRVGSTTHRQGRSFPPGPAGLPVIGNLLDFPDPSTPWLGYRDLSRRYGPMTFLQVLGQSILIIDSADVAFDLLEKRSSLYSSRPESTMVKLGGWDWVFAFMPYGQRWRQHRRVFWEYFRPSALPALRPAQEEGMRRLLSGLLESPSNVYEHIRYAVGTANCKAAHGLEVAHDNDSKMAVFEKAQENVAFLTEGSTLLEYLPFLARVPKWVPGASFLRWLEESREAAWMLRDMPWIEMKDAVRSGQYHPSVASSMLEKLSIADPAEAEAEEGLAMSAVATAYSAGLDTVNAVLQAFFAAMTLHPNAQGVAQAELDAVVGPNRLPTFDDRQNLPYVNALLKELYRWHNATPLGVAHQSIADDEYNGYFIPAHTTVFVNEWSILHDPATYPDPESFIPERYLQDGMPNPDVRDPTTILFGFGRRICPGRYYADASLFLFVASVLHVFRISPPLDNQGKEIRIQPRATPGLVSYVENWSCIIKPRSASAEVLIKSVTQRS